MGSGDWTVVWTELVVPWPLLVAGLIAFGLAVWDLGQVAAELIIERIRRA